MRPLHAAFWLVIHFRLVARSAASGCEPQGAIKVEETAD